MKPAHQPFIEQCIADFGLQFRSEPGLSIIIPFPRVRWGSAGDDDDGAGLNCAELLDAVIRNYFYPIIVIAGRLEVVVDAGPGADAAVSVNGDTIDRVMAELDLPETGEWSLPSYRRLFAMCRASLERADGAHKVLLALPTGNRERYDAARLANWRRRYQAGNLLALMEAPTEEVQKDAFADIFFWDGGNGRNDGRRIREGSSTYQTGKPRSPRRPQEFAVVPIDGGFRVRLAEGIPDPPACVRVRVAYDTPRGNPLNRYSQEDFRLHGRNGDLALRMGGCRFRPGQAGNEIFLDIDDPADFEFAASGFDPQRDVYVRIERIGESDSEEPAV